MSKKKFSAIAVASALALASVEFHKIHAKAWFKKGHITIVEQAFEILKNDEKSRDIKLLEAFSDQIITGATIPDVKGDIDNGSGLHYYNSKNKFGFPIRLKDGYYPNRLGGYSKSAGTMLEENYYTALIFWQNGKYNTSAVLLGRAVHFLSDICCTPHTTARVCTGSPKNCHFAFETYANKLNGVFISMTAKEFYNKFLALTPLGIADFLSQVSSSYFDKLISKKSENFAQIVVGTFPLAQTATAAFLNKFLAESEHPPLIDENKTYTIKNCESGLFLHQNGSLDPQSESFKIAFNQNGTLSFKNSQGELLIISGEISQFKLTLINDNIHAFRITAGKKFRQNLCEFSLLKTTKLGFYKPDSDLHLWRILESYED